MADSPLDNSDGVVDFTIKSEGNAITCRGTVRSVVIHQQVNRLSRCTIEIEDGSLAEQTSPISNSDEFKPGVSISVSANYDEQTSYSLFEGIVTSHGLRVDESSQLLIVECIDQAVTMTVGRNSANYISKKDSDIFSSLIGKHSPLTSGSIASTTVTYSELVQYNCSDWDFMVTRAESNGLLIKNLNNEISVIDPSTSESAKLTLTLGKDINQFDADIDARYLFKNVSANSWDQTTQAVVNDTAEPQTVTATDNLSASDLAGVLSLSSYRMQTVAQQPDGAMAAWAKAQQVKSALAKTCGTVSYRGCAKAVVGDFIEIASVGERFDGEVFISALCHDIRRGDWQTTAEFGLAAHWFAEQQHSEAHSAQSLLPAIQGLTVGKVLKLDEDPNQENRIQVSVPINGAEDQGVWARLIQFYASSGFGSFFIPEIDDEVILGFLNNDPSCPVIIGSVYSSKQAPAYDVNDNEENKYKALVTKSGHTVEFDDDKKIITIKTPAGNQLVFSDDDESITLTDQNNNEIKTNDSGISLTSPKDLNLKASGDISLTADGKVAIAATQDATISGLNVQASANVGFAAKGEASAELSASGQTTVKGAMVMIN
ncbi:MULTISPECIES: type VI secretion system tip protein VgrG [unclassified Agarivorans]|uniref:type VI secretion system tip protein VgrG n=1 Tax=unclassified Agarivorans TaxID=2636026 RepID=UPI0026E3DDA3|nr:MULTISPECIES: type VI secretion system tip protein VgrG [unclassified Agarivorans]MDO6686769.1 type VI secretion system tip protein VgrG [Agarivorans sp. 3_MG-2023]MDO6716501.1 type VI secretion system tip protein VgrG [Agarivorans sp. 2_MG-2023]